MKKNYSLRSGVYIQIEDIPSVLALHFSLSLQLVSSLVFVSPVSPFLFLGQIYQAYACFHAGVLQMKIEHEKPMQGNPSEKTNNDHIPLNYKGTTQNSRALYIRNNKWGNQEVKFIQLRISKKSCNSSIYQAKAVFQRFQNQFSIKEKCHMNLTNI